MDVNVTGTRNLLSASVKEKVSKFVFISSCAVYGEPDHLPVSESHPTSPISPYAESKLKAEDCCLVFHERKLLKTLVFRLFNVYVPRQDINEYSGMITRFSNCCEQGLPLTIYGDGSQTRVFTHVYDVSDIVANVVEQDSTWGQVFNIGSGKATSIRELADAVLSKRQA